MSRIGHCRGFGIQSPTDYNFVCNVVNERRPYYAYETLGKGSNRLRRKLGKLYFRLANYLQPDTIDDLDGYADWLTVACKKARLCHPPQPAALVIAPIEEDPQRILSLCQEQTVLAVSNIWKDMKKWNMLACHSKATIVFDLYYCGIAFFDPKRAKQQYIVNF